MRKLAVLMIGLAVSVLIVSAADVSGIWLGSGTTGGKRNQVLDISFQFIQKGATLTGKLYLESGGSAPILKGAIDGEKITFQVATHEQAGNEINQAVFRFTGTIKDGEIEITREREEVRAAGNSGAAFARPGSQTFHLKRLP